MGFYTALKSLTFEIFSVSQSSVYLIIIIFVDRIVFWRERE